MESELGYRDRHYNSEGGGDGRGFLGGNHMSLLGFSAPFGRWFGVRVRLNIWMLLILGLMAISYFGAGQPLMFPIAGAFLILSAMLHEFGHRAMVMRYGRRHDEFVLWPGGGIGDLDAPPRPLASFVVHSAGIITNLLLAIGGLAGLWFLTGRFAYDELNPLQVLSGRCTIIGAGGADLPTALLWMFVSANLGVAFLAILPYYWFDGAKLVESILWPWTGLRKAIDYTCIFGMAFAVVLFVVGVISASLWGMIWGGLLFYVAFQRRKMLQYEDVEYDLTAAYSVADEEPRRSPVRKARLQRWLMDRRAQKLEKLEKQVDEILDKVARTGMQSLTSGEKKLLEQASRELREQESPRR